MASYLAAYRNDCETSYISQNNVLVLGKELLKGVSISDYEYLDALLNIVKIGVEINIKWDVDDFSLLCIPNDELNKVSKTYMDENFFLAIKEIDKDTICSLKNAIRILELLENWKDSREKVNLCNIRIKELKEKEEIEKKASAQFVRKFLLITLSVIFFVLLVMRIYTDIVVPYQRYNEAKALVSIEEYEAAILIFSTLGDYKDCQAQITNCNMAIKDNTYKKAIEYMKNSDYEDAYLLFSELNEYRDSQNRKNELIDLNYKLTFLDVKNGESIKFGKYEQDNVLSNGKEDIEWIVLDRKDNKLFLVSKYCLDTTDSEMHQEMYFDFYWKRSKIKNWLNTTFLTDSFSIDEQMLIAHSQDEDIGKVTLLDEREAYTYFKSEESRKARTTKYVIENNKDMLWDDDNGNVYWWLRSSMFKTAEAITADGTTRSAYNTRENGYCSSYNAIRPAMWIYVTNQK